MSTRNPMPDVRRIFFDTRSGAPVVAAGYKLHVYLVGTSTDTPSYQNDGSTNSNPITLDSEGGAEINLDTALTYKFELRVPADTTVVWDADNIPGSIPANAPWTLELDGIGVTSTDALIIKNASVSANGAQQMSPAIRLTGAGWNATSSASRVVDGKIEVLPIQQVSGDPVSAINLSTQVNAGGYTTQLSVRSDAVNLRTAQVLGWGSSGVNTPDLRLSRAATKKLQVDDGTGVGVILDVSTSGTLTLLNAQTGLNINATMANINATLSNSGGRVGIAVKNTGGSAAGTISRLSIGMDTSESTAGILQYNHASDLMSLVNLKASTGVLEMQTAGGGISILNAGDVRLDLVTAKLQWTTQSSIANVSDGMLALRKNSGVVGVNLKFSTDGELHVRDRSDSNFADLRANNIRSSGEVESTNPFVFNGVGGVNTFGPAAVISITVKGGIITAIS